MSLDLTSVSIDNFFSEFLTEQSSLVNTFVLFLDSLVFKHLTFFPLLSMGFVLTEGWNVVGNSHHGGTRSNFMSDWRASTEGAMSKVIKSSFVMSHVSF